MIALLTILCAKVRSGLVSTTVVSGFHIGFLGAMLLCGSHRHRAIITVAGCHLSASYCLHVVGQFRASSGATSRCDVCNLALPPHPGCFCCCCQIFSRGIRESPEDVSFLCHSLGSLELAAKRPAEAMDVFVAGIERY